MDSQIFSYLLSGPLELILLVAAVVIDIFLAIAVYRNNPQSATNRIFSLLAIATALWLAAAHFSWHTIEPIGLSIFLHRLGIFVAAPHSLLFFLLARTMPSDTIPLTKRTVNLSLLATTFVMILNISPYAFVGISVSDDTSQPIAGPGIAPFALLAVTFSFLAIFWLVRKYMHSDGVERNQIQLVLIGMVLMLTSIIGSILIPIAIFGSTPALALAPLFTLVFLGMTAYAITKYRLFNIKVLVTEALTAIIWIVLFAKLFGEETQSGKIVDGLILLFTLIFGFFLVRSVRREVEQRERIEKQEKELEIANQQQESLLHFISHEIKGYLTESQAGFASIIEGDFGSITPQLKTMAESALKSVRRGVATVMDILDASNLKKGTVAYAKKKFDFQEAIRETVKELQSAAAAKGISIDLQIGEGQFLFEGDEEKIRRHVIRNLVDNAIKYTPQGSVRVELTDGNVIRFSVQDSGVGITTEDMPKLFTEGGHGKDSIKINVHSTGYGLFIAKQVVEAHGGKIWAESEGQGKGSRFVVEFPA